MSGFFDQLTSSSAAPEPDQQIIEQGISSAAEEKAGEQRTESRLRDAAKDLLKFGLIEMEHKPNLFRTATVQREALNLILEPLDLIAMVDDIRGLVFLAVRPDTEASSDEAEEDGWSHPLVRKQRLTLEQSLMVAILRQIFVAHEQEAGTGAEPPLVALDDLVAQLQLYLGDSGSEQKERNRTLTLLDQLKGYGLVTALDAHERVAIRPIITHLANPDNLSALLAALKQRLAAEQESDS